MRLCDFGALSSVPYKSLNPPGLGTPQKIITCPTLTPDPPPLGKKQGSAPNAYSPWREQKNGPRKQGKLRKRRGVQKSMGNEVPWKIGVLICLPVTSLRNVPVTPTPSIFPKVLPYKWGAYCRTNGRRTAVQIGGVMQGFPFFEA